MGRIQTVAAVVGIAAGSLTIGGVYLFGVGIICGGGLLLPPNVVFTCPRPLGPWPQIDQAVAAVLILASLASFVGPKKVFYVSAALSALLALLVQMSVLNLLVIFTVVLTIAAFALSLVAARREIRVSEQSNPMNLPVFG